MPTEEQQAEVEKLNKSIKKHLKISKKIDNIIFIVLILLLAYIGSTIYDGIKLSTQGNNLVKYHDFDELRKENSDVCAWITLEGTHIDHPVVQGKDNFEYLDKDFNGDHYTGGTLFLDYENKKDFSDDYNVIHGHHMTGGAMFGDLTKYKKEDFFNEHTTGTLLTPTYDYDLKVIAVAKVNAYDSTIYNVKGSSEAVLAYSKEVSIHSRNITLEKGEKIITLSTCSGDMNEDRIVLICKMYGKRAHE